MAKILVRAVGKVVRPAIDMTLSNIGTINNANYPYQLEKSLQFIRDERARELYGENHWWWDLRRWRTADQVLNNFRPNMLRSEEHTSELQSLMRTSYDVFCLKKKQHLRYCTYRYML